MVGGVVTPEAYRTRKLAGNLGRLALFGGCYHPGNREAPPGCGRCWLHTIERPTSSGYAIIADDSWAKTSSRISNI